MKERETEQLKKKKDAKQQGKIQRKRETEKLQKKG
jgi:hypothetical protein